jgi:FkbM family methyltransferase
VKKFKLISKLFYNTKPAYIDNIHGHRLYIDDRDSLGLIRHGGIFEPLETTYFSNEIKENDIILDIGANIGYYTLLFAQRVGDGGHVYAFEPEPQNFELLKKNVQTSGYRNVTLINMAVSDTTSKLRLYLNKKNKADHRIFDWQDRRKFIEIDSTRLDDYFSDFTGDIAFIKMDIQGAEYRALSGMLSLLARNPKTTIVMEFEPQSLLLSGIEPRICLELLLKQGFTLYNINNKNGSIHKIDFKELLNIYTPDKRHHTNIICKK